MSPPEDLIPVNPTLNPKPMLRQSPQKSAVPSSPLRIVEDRIVGLHLAVPSEAPLLGCRVTQRDSRASGFQVSSRLAFVVLSRVCVYKKALGEFSQM